MPTCEEATYLASTRLDDGASLAQRMRLTAHLAICAWCRRYVRQIKLLRRAMRRLAETAGRGRVATLPEETRQKMKAALHGAAASPVGPEE